MAEPRAPPARARPPVDDAHLRGALDGGEVQRAVPLATSRKGQTGLSIAFDLPTQTGYDSDHELARGEVGKVGVPDRPQGRHARAAWTASRSTTMNTSMTINATAAWLLALYIVTAEENGVDPTVLQGTTQNDIIKEFLARGTYAFPPGPSMRLIADMIAYTVTEVPKWNPINICSYHLQEAGATPVQEIAFAMSNAIAVLDAVRERVPEELMGKVFGRISFFVNAGVRFVEEHAKLRAMGGPVGADRPRALRRRRREAPALPLRRAGQLARAHRGAAREQRPADRARGARRDARPRRPRPRRPAARLERGARPAPPLGSAVVAAHPADPRLRDRPARVPRHLRRARTSWRAWSRSCSTGARAEMAVVAEHGGAVAAVPYMKAALVDSHRDRIRRIEARRPDRRRPEPVPGHRAVAAGRRRGRRDPDRRPRRRGRAGRRARRSGGPGATRPRSTPRSPSCGASPQTTARTSCPRRSPPPARASRPASGRRRCATSSATTARRPASARRARGAGDEADLEELRDEVARVVRGARPARSRSSSASPASTGTPTAPSRSPCAPATSAWTSSTRASA